MEIVYQILLYLWSLRSEQKQQCGPVFVNIILKFSNLGWKFFVKIELM